MASCQRRGITSRTSPVGAFRLDRDPFHTHPGNIDRLVEVFSRVDSGKGALNSRPRPIEVTLPDGQVGLPDRHIKKLAGAGEGNNVLQALGDIRSPTGHLHREPVGGHMLYRHGHHPLRNSRDQPLALVPVTDEIADHAQRAAHPDPRPAKAGPIGQLDPLVIQRPGGRQVPEVRLQHGEVLQRPQLDLQVASTQPPALGRPHTASVPWPGRPTPRSCPA